MSPGRYLEDVSWETSLGQFLEDVLATSYKKVLATSISGESKTSLRPKIRRLYNGFATSLCWLGGRHSFFTHIYHYPEVWCNRHVAAFFETSVLKEVLILYPLSPQQYQNAANTKGPK